MFSKNANMQNKAKQSKTTQTQNRNQRTVSSCLLTFIFSFAQNTNSRRCLRAGSSRLQLRLSSRGVYQCALPRGGSWVHFPLPLFIPYFFTLFCGDFPTLSFQHPRSANTVVSAVTVLPAHWEMIFTETAAAAQSVPDVRLFSLCGPAFLRWPHGRFLPAVRKRPWPRWVVASVAYGRSSRSPPSRLRQRHPWG